MPLADRQGRNTIIQLNSKFHYFRFILVLDIDLIHDFLFSNSYDPDNDRWTLVQPMHFKRLGVGVAVVNRMLYAIGGFNGEARLTSIECYHPENNAWTILPPMKTGRSGAGVAA